MDFDFKKEELLDVILKDKKRGNVVDEIIKSYIEHKMGSNEIKDIKFNNSMLIEVTMETPNGEVKYYVPVNNKNFIRGRFNSVFQAKGVKNELPANIFNTDVTNLMLEEILKRETNQVEVAVTKDTLLVLPDAEKDILIKFKDMVIKSKKINNLYFSIEDNNLIVTLIDNRSSRVFEDLESRLFSLLLILPEASKLEKTYVRRGA